MSEKAARQVIVRQCEGVLRPDIVLPFDDPELAGRTVGDVLANPEFYEGETLADPLAACRTEGSILVSAADGVADHGDRGDHPVFRNPDVKTFKHEGRFCGHFSRAPVSEFRSLFGDIVFKVTFGAPVSGGENPVPNSNRALAARMGQGHSPSWENPLAHARHRLPAKKSPSPRCARADQLGSKKGERDGHVDTE